MLIHINRQANVAVLSKLKDFSRSQKVTYTVKVVIISETVQDRNVVTTDYDKGVIYDLSNSDDSDDLERLSRSFTYS